jgi:hypothetical protein
LSTPINQIFEHYDGYATLIFEAKTKQGGDKHMDFMNRGNRPVQQNTPIQSQDNGIGAPKSSDRKSSKFQGNKWVKIGYVAFLAAIAILILAVVLSVVFAKDNTSSNEKAFVKNDKFQAVFLNGGQVYFGKITDLNSKYVNMNNIYYLRVNQQVQPDQANKPASANDVSLVKLGCELHGPEDSMVINREQIIFWENLKTDGQVAKTIAEFVKANPKGQDCAAQQQQNSTNNSGNTNSTTNTSAGTTNR